MLLSIEKEVVDQLLLLQDKKMEEVSELCNQTIDCLKGCNDNNEDVVESIGYLLLQSCKRGYKTKKDFADNFLVAIGKECPDILAQCFSDNYVFLCEILGESLALPLNQFKGLSWRFDVELGSRALRRQVSPLWMIQISTSKNTFDIQSDLTNLKHFHTQLSLAFLEYDQAYVRRITRNIK